MVCVVRTALTLRWLPRHLLMVVLVITLSLLGRWQWDVAQSARGGLQNFLYAFQWWVMAAMVIYGWWRLLRDTAHPQSRPNPETLKAQPAVVTSDDWFATPAPAATSDEVIDDDDDLAAYNEYLARLNDRAERTR